MNAKKMVNKEVGEVKKEDREVGKGGGAHKDVERLIAMIGGKKKKMKKGDCR